MNTLRDSGRQIGERIDQLRAEPGDDIFSRIIHNGTSTVSGTSPRAQTGRCQRV
ncbi:hypothetical protein [Mycobacterium sp. 1245111.1]|uniref:hypothetical protein n=1 Tax=Mycobacterium sp. 1245111.1 TaxID=1834073 RepID=UPI000AA24A51|nr:hypothetical protein [Mycobacterium sp. 1245111.1]